MEVVFFAHVRSVMKRVYFQTDLVARGGGLRMGLAMGRARMRKVGTSSFFGWVSAAVGGTRAGKTEPQEEQQLGAAVHRMFAAMEVPESVESFDGQSQHSKEPADQQTVGMMMTDVLEAVTALGVIETLVLSGKGLARC